MLDEPTSPARGDLYPKAARRGLRLAGRPGGGRGALQADDPDLALPQPNWLENDGCEIIAE
jgi:hypothetical protein